MKPIQERVAHSLVNALRSGTVAREGLEYIAVTVDGVQTEIENELDRVAKGASAFRLVRGDYGSGKTFMASMIGALAMQKRFVVSKVVISRELQLYKTTDLYRNLCRNLYYQRQESALRLLVEAWINDLETKVCDTGMSEEDPGFLDAVCDRIETYLAGIDEQIGRMATVLRAYARLRFEDRTQDAQLLLDWMCGDQNVPAASVTRLADVKGKLEDSDVKFFLRGLLEIIRFRQAGLVLIVDELETASRLPSNLAKKTWEALKDWTNAISDSEYPGLFMVATGTPAILKDEEKGIPSVPALHQRLRIDEPKPGDFINYRNIQIPLFPFDKARLQDVAVKVLNIYPATHAERVRKLADQSTIDFLLGRFEEAFGQNLAVAPRLFLRKWVDTLDLIDQHEKFDPKRDLKWDADWVKQHAQSEEEQQALVGV